jgi:hypothetical protein
MSQEVAQGIIHKIITAMVAGRATRAETVRHLETTDNKSVLLLEPVATSLLPEALAQIFVSAYPGTTIDVGGIRKLGADGTFPTPEGPMSTGHKRLSLKQKSSATYMIPLESWSQKLIKDICTKETIEIGTESFGAHLLPAQNHVLVPVEITRDTRVDMHIMMS